MTSKRWCFTWNNPGALSPGVVREDIAYLVYQKEKGAEGTVHWQGYVRFHVRKRMNTVKNLFGEQGLHLEVARGTEKECKEYCTKEPTRTDPPETYEGGDYDENEGTQGRRSDLEGIATAIRGGASLTVIAQDHPSDFIRYHSGIAALHERLSPRPPIERPVQVLVFWGPTGVGKTHRVLNEYPDCYQVDGRGRDPWGHYRGEATLFMDEFNFEQWSIQEMNKVLDKWRYRLDARYHDRYAEWTRVAICCNQNPSSWYPYAPMDLRESLHRRLRGNCWWVGAKEETLEEIRARGPTEL